MFSPYNHLLQYYTSFIIVGTVCKMNKSYWVHLCSIPSCILGPV
nr:MAG TPA: hypothetical protein [Caudoviricetes sp.]